MVAWNNTETITHGNSDQESKIQSSCKETVQLHS